MNRIEIDKTMAEYLKKGGYKVTRETHYFLEETQDIPVPVKRTQCTAKKFKIGPPKFQSTSLPKSTMVAMQAFVKYSAGKEFVTREDVKPVIAAALEEAGYMSTTASPAISELIKKNLIVAA
jgi:hypothetical protein